MTVETSSTNPHQEKNSATSGGLPVFKRIDTSLFAPGNDRDGVVERRHRIANVAQRIIPVALYATEGAIEAARGLREGNIPIIIAHSHSRMRDPIDAENVTVQLGEGFDDAEYAGPVSAHQWRKPYIRFLADQSTMNAYPIVTQSTIDKGKNIEKFSLPKKTEIAIRDLAEHLPGVPPYERPQPKKLSRGTGLNEYLNGSVETLKHHGIVFIAPQGERRPTLGNPIGATEMLVRRAEKTGLKMDEVAIWPMGIMIMDEDHPDQHDPNLHMLHSVGKTAIVKVEAPIMASELMDQAKDQKTSLDQQIFTQLRRVLPHSYYTE